MARDIKQIWYLYQARRVNTQTNGAGGALRTRISVPAGQVAKLVQVYAEGTASAGSSLSSDILDEDGAQAVRVAYVAAGATREFKLPSIGSAATAHGNIADTNGMIIGPGQFLIIDASAALQTETLKVGVTLLLSTSTEPTWDTTGSAGTPSLAASTISAANTMVAVVM